MEVGYNNPQVKGINGSGGVISVECEYGVRYFNVSECRDIFISKENSLDILYADHHANRHYDFAEGMAVNVRLAVKSAMGLLGEL